MEKIEVVESDRSVLSRWYLDQVIDHLAEAWLMIHDPRPGWEKDNDALVVSAAGYLSDDWTKDTSRLLKDWAQAHPRPQRWPWEQPDFDRFWPRP